MTSTLSAFSPGAGQTRSAVPKPQTAIGPASSLMTGTRARSARAELPLGKEVRELLGAAPAAEPDAVSVPLRRTGYSTTDILTLKEKSV